MNETNANFSNFIYVYNKGPYGDEDQPLVGS